LSNDESKKQPTPGVRTQVFDACPHCGTELSPWEKVLLSIDRALMCKHCWYRIILDVFDEGPSKDEKPKPKGQEK
jgi:DNA-directed RNA polymerase subunit RPC12/RpoP